MSWICNVQFVPDESHRRVALWSSHYLEWRRAVKKNWLSGQGMKNAANLASVPQASLPTADTDRLIIFRGIPIDPTKRLRQVLQRHTEWQLITSGCSAALEHNSTTRCWFPASHSNTAPRIQGRTGVQIINESKGKENKSHLFHF